MNIAQHYSSELIEALQDYLVAEGERTEGQAAVFKRQAHSSENESGRVEAKRSGVSITCFKCGKVGHKASDCWQRGGVAPPAVHKQGGSSGALPSKIVCYTCGEEGHKSTSCPKVKKERVSPKEGVAKPIRQLWLRDSKDTVLEGVVNGKGASLLLDSGASISIVPEVMVGEELLTGNKVAVRAFQSKVPLLLPTAKVTFRVGKLGWEEVVALAPVEVGKETEVLYGLDLTSERGLDLVLMANQLEQSLVKRVVTRSEARKESSEGRETAKVVAKEQPVARPVVEYVKVTVEAAGCIGKKGVGKERPVADRPAGVSDPTPSEVVTGSEQGAGKGDPVADRPAGDPEPVSQEVVLEEEEELDLDFLEEEEVSTEEEEVEFEVRKGSEGIEDLEVPPVKPGNSSRAELEKEVKVDFEEDECVGTKLYGKSKDFDEAEVDKIKRDYPEVFSDLPGKTKVCRLRIATGLEPPIVSHPYRIPDRLKAGVREEVLKLVELGIAVPSVSAWASPVVPVPKPDGSIHVCVDYRKLNSITQGDPYYMATLDEILERVSSSRVMSKLDLAKGFYQVEVEPSSREKTAFICPFGKFEFTRMPFGLKNAPGIFQGCMEVVLAECYSYSAPYIDDIIVFSSSGEEHVVHLRKVVSALSRHGMTVKENKCSFGKLKLEYLGHVIGGGELAVPAHRAAAMAEYIRPVTKRQLRSFLGAAGYYRQFVKGFARLSAVLSPWTSKSAPNVIGWTEEGLEAFKCIRVSLVDVCNLTIPSQEDVFCLHTDASGAGIGATLNVMRQGKEYPAAYFSRQLQGAQHNYSATELEGLAVFKSVYFFSHFLFGARFKVVTDHKALVSLLQSQVLNRRLYGWLMQLLQFDFVIEYRPGSENSDADALSRQAWDTRAGSPWRASVRAAEVEDQHLQVKEQDQEKERVKDQEEDQRRQLRAAAVFVVGGDVGTEVPHKEEQCNGGGAQPGCGAAQPKDLNHVTQIT